MATIRKRGRRWQAQICRNKLSSVTKSFIFKKDAERWVVEVEAAMERRD